MVIRVQGMRPENFLLLVHEIFEALIYESFKGIDYEFFIPCTDCLQSVCAMSIFSYTMCTCTHIKLQVLFLPIYAISLRKSVQNMLKVSHPFYSNSFSTISSCIKLHRMKSYYTSMLVIICETTLLNNMFDLLTIQSLRFLFKEGLQLETLLCPLRLIDNFTHAHDYLKKCFQRTNNFDRLTNRN